MILASAVYFSLSFLGRVACNANDLNFTMGVFLRSDGSYLTNLRQYAEAVSNPSSSSYGVYLSQDKIREMIAMPSSATGEALSWLKSALLSVNSRVSRNHSLKPDLKTSSNEHGDVVTALVKDWRPLFLLGLAIATKSGTNTTRDAGISNPTADFAKTLSVPISLPPARVELIVVPGAPDGYCQSFTAKGRKACESSGPCFWENTTSTISKLNSSTSIPNAPVSLSNESNESTMNKSESCVGDSAGLICWPETKHARRHWRCFDPLVVDYNDGIAKRSAGGHSLQKDLWRRRRRGVRRSADHDERIEKSARQENGLWRVAAASKAMTMIYVPPKEGASWTGLEFSYRQMGAAHSISLQLEEFTRSTQTGHYLYEIFGLENLYPVTDMFVCMEVNRSTTKVAQGCTCNLTASKDLFGRSCERVYAALPTKDPVASVVPCPLQSLKALHHDMGIVPSSLSDTRQASQAVAEFAYQAFGEKDIPDICKSYGLDASALNISVHGPDSAPGENHTLQFDNAGEGGLDMQIVTMLAPGSPTTWLGIDPYNLDGFMLALAVQLNAEPNPPLVVSISWGAAEVAYPQSFVKRFDYELMKLVLRGLTVLVASGDNGISAVSSNCEFVADLGGSSPWVTSVGATMQSMQASPYCHDRRFTSAGGICEDRGPIVASTTSGSSITSSGYWSGQRKRPQYQTDVVRQYLSISSLANESRSKNLSMRCCLIDTCDCPLEAAMLSGRGSPDIAAPGHNFAEVMGGEVALVDGTSASAPVIAAVISRLNAEQLKRGEPPLGFLNPWLYGLYRNQPHAFVDVTVGSIASTTDFICPSGFPAKPGWDAATGLGVPQFSMLLQNLPSRQKTTQSSPSFQRQGTLLESFFATQLLNFNEFPHFGMISQASALGIVLISVSVFFCWRLHAPSCREGAFSQPLLCNEGESDEYFLHT